MIRALLKATCVSQIAVMSGAVSSSLNGPLREAAPSPSYPATQVHHSDIPSRSQVNLKTLPIVPVSLPIVPVSLPLLLTLSAVPVPI